MMPSTPCCIATCWKSSASRHRFPNPMKFKLLFDKWRIFCGNKRLVTEVTSEQVYNSFRVCSLHFRAEDFGFNNKLKRGVVPSLFLPDPLEPSKDMSGLLQSEKDGETASTSHQEICNITEDMAVPVLASDIHLQETENEIDTPVPSVSNVEQNVTVALLETPKRRSALLSEVHVSQVKDLTPKARHFYRRAIEFKKKALHASKQKLSFRERLKRIERCTNSEMFEKVVSSMDRIKSRFFQSQIENTGKKPKGRRYTLEDKVLALALYKQSGAGYRFLAKLFALPSRKTLMQLLNRIPIRPGLHEEVFTVLKAEIRNFTNPLDTYCILLFDEINIQANLHLNSKEGKVEGFEDFRFKTTDKIANHSQVFMLRGIRRKWKQPVFYNFVSGGTKKHDLMHIIKMIIRKCHSIGLNVVSTICDQGANNQAAIQSLVDETHREYRRKMIDNNNFHFEVDGHKIIPLFDVPHLFKGLRNNLLKYDLCYIEDGKPKLAKWTHIYTAYKMDPYLGNLRLMPKLTDSHVNPEKIDKMKVSKCTQVFSHSVAAAINVFAFSGTTVQTEEELLTLDKSAMDTAAVIEFFDNLFDTLNGSSFTPYHGKSFRTAVTKGSLHWKFWFEALRKLRFFNFVRNGNNFVPPSLKNLSRTIKNFEDLCKLLFEFGFNYVMPRTFNQDPLENFFAKMRQKGHRNVNPTPTSFTHYYKSLLVNQLTSCHSINANCEDDDSSMFLTLQRLVSQGLPEEEENQFLEDFCTVPETLPSSERPLDTMILKYVAGYVAKKIGRQACECRNNFFKRQEPADFENEDFLQFKEYSDKSRHLKYVNASFVKKMKEAFNIIKYIFNRELHKKGIVNYTLKVLCQKISFTHCFHDNHIKTQIFKYFIKINIFNYCKQLNRIIKGLDHRPVPKSAPKIFINARILYSNTIKRKRAQNKSKLI